MCTYVHIVSERIRCQLHRASRGTEYRLVDMYTKCTETSTKEEIVTEFSKKDGRLRIVIGTIAFGMGLDCPDV